MANFDLLLSKLQAVDEGLEDLNKADFDQLIGDLKGKVDSIYYVLTKLGAESDRLADVIKKLQEKKKAIDNGAKRLKDWSVISMSRHDMPYLEGDNFTMRIMSSESVKLNENITLDSQAFMKYPGLIRRKFEWDKAAVKTAIKTGKFENVGEMIPSKYVKFAAKGGKK